MVQILELKDPYNDISSSIQTFDLRYKKLEELRKVLLKKKFLTSYSKFLRPYSDERMNQTKYSRITESEERTDNVCSVISCDHSKCTLFVQRGEYSLVKKVECI